MAESSQQTSINIPQLVAVAVVGFFALRWFLSRRPSPSDGSSRRNGSGVNVANVEYLSSMFPQFDRRTIAWDLHRNGGSVSATTERVLSGRSLDTPPLTYQPNLPPPPAAQNSATEGGAAAAGAGAGAGASSAGNRKGASTALPDLITRYNLQSRISGKQKEAVVNEDVSGGKGKWSSDKNARAEALRRRREEMVLAARRRMQEQTDAS